MTQPAPPRTPAEVVTHLNALSESLASVVDQYTRLSGDMEKFEKGRKERDAATEKQNRRRFRAMLALILLIGLGAGVSVFTGIKATEAVHLLVDCTVEGGECYKRGTKRTGGAIQELDNRDLYGNIAIVQCSRELGPGNSDAWDKAFEQCVVARKADLAKRQVGKK